MHRKSLTVSTVQVSSIEPELLHSQSDNKEEERLWSPIRSKIVRLNESWICDRGGGRRVVALAGHRLQVCV